MNEIIDLVKAMNNLPKSKENYHSIEIVNTHDEFLDYEELTEWCGQNCKHPWKSIIAEFEGHGWMASIMGPANFTFLFKHDDDATMFKLVWK